MKKIHSCLLALTLLLFLQPVVAQNVAINEDGSLPDKNALLDVKSPNKGILIPRMSSSTRISIPATKGLLVYDTTTNSFWYNTGVNWQNLSAGAGAWSLAGNTGIDSTSFIGTTDGKPFTIKVDGIVSGRIEPAVTGTTSYGYNAGFKGTNNTAMGIHVLPVNTGNYNTCIGAYGLYNNTTGSQNTANGYSSLNRNTTGSGNTATGNESLVNNTTGFSNTATGDQALFGNTTGYNNTANGTASLLNNTTGNYNTANGDHSLYANRTGFYNTANGFNALGSDTSGTNNTAMGAQSLVQNTIGHFNTGIGSSALYNNTTGSYNTVIGASADVSTTNLTNATAIGYKAIANASNKVRIGNSLVTVIEGQVPFTTPSDGRFKFNVQEDVKGLDFITQLRPVTYQFDVKRFDGQQASASGNSDAQWAFYNEATLMRRSGFIAQEVEKAAIASGYNFSGIITPKTPQEHYGLSYESFVVPLVKAVQELQQENNSLKKQLEEQKNKQEDQNAKLTSLQQQLDALKQLLPNSK